MNTLSLLLYLSDVVDGLGSVTGWGIGLSAVAFIFGLFVWIATVEYAYERNDASAIAGNKFAVRIIKIAPWVFALSILASVFVPSRTTILSIGASEALEEVLATDAVKQIGGEAGGIVNNSLQLLNKYINDQLDTTTETPVTK